MTERISDERLAELAIDSEKLASDFGTYEDLEEDANYRRDLAVALRELQELREAKRAAVAEARALDNAAAGQMIDRMTDDELGL